MSVMSEEWKQRTELLLGKEKTERLSRAHVLVVGLGGGFALPPISLFLPRIVTPRQRTFGVAIIMSVAQVGQFVSPVYTDLFVDNSMDDAGRMRFIVCAITSVVIGFLVLAFAHTLPKKPLEN